MFITFLDDILQDMKVNSRKVKVHTGNGLFVDKAWRSLSVGDVVKVLKDEYFPSDRSCALVASFIEDLSSGPKSRFASVKI